LLEPGWHIKLFQGLLDSSLIRTQKLKLVFGHLFQPQLRERFDKIIREASFWGF